MADFIEANNVVAGGGDEGIVGLAWDTYEGHARLTLFYGAGIENHNVVSFDRHTPLPERVEDYQG